MATGRCTCHCCRRGRRRGRRCVARRSERLGKNKRPVLAERRDGTLFFYYLIPQEPQVGIEPTTARLRIECSTPELLWRGNLMPWLGFEPRRLAAPPPQDGVSTSFTTRARISSIMSSINPPMPMLQPASKPHYEPILPTGATGLEPATSRVTVECSNQTELRPLNPTLPLHPAPTSCVSRRRRGDRIAPTGVEPVSAP